MAVVKINALAIPPQAGDEIVKRFAARMDEMAAVAGFQGFELLQPTGEAETRWFVYTRWADEESYQAWRDGDSFARGHGRAADSSDTASAAGSAIDDEDGNGPRPLSTGATLLEFDVRLTARGPAAD